MNAMSILGTGAVTPTAPGTVESLRHPGRTFAVRRVEDEALHEVSREARLRRASRITFLMAAAARQALRGAAPRRLAIVGAFFTGPCHFSRLFFQPVLEKGASFASPALFPETVYNSSLSHVAHVLGVTGACYAAVGDDSAWVTALHVASVWLEMGIADAVLVIGAEELDASAVEAYAAAGWLKGGLTPAEGAAALLLGPSGPADTPNISALLNGRSYRSKRAARIAVARCFSEMNDAPILPTASDTWLCDAEKSAASGHEFPGIEPPHRGHAFTASAGWNTIRAIRWLRDHARPAGLWVPVLGLHHQISGLRLDAPACPQLAVPSHAG